MYVIPNRRMVGEVVSLPLVWETPLRTGNLRDPNGPQSTQHMVGWNALTNPYRGCDLSDPNHGWNAGRAQRDLGFLAPTANDDLTMFVYTAYPGSRSQESLNLLASWVATAEHETPQLDRKTPK